MIVVTSVRERFRRSSDLPEVKIHGRHSPDWMAALHPRSTLWTLLERSAKPATKLGSLRRKRIVVPLMERHAASMPANCFALAPDRTALAVFGDKALFRRYASANGLAHLLPAAIDPANPSFPAVLKRTDLNSANGVTLVMSREELASRLDEAPWRGERVILEEHVASLTDYVTHMVCDRGRVLWHCTYRYALDGEQVMRGAAQSPPIDRVEASADDIANFERLLRPLRYDGPANIDYRRRADGSLAIFEINPRLGGSLMRPENAHDLAAAFDAIIRHARWQGGAKGSA